MRASATVSLFLLLFVSSALAQSELPRSYSVGGLVIVPHTSNYDPMEVRLITDTEISVGRTIVRPQERFVFNNVPAGRYYFVMNVPGFKPIRQRVTVAGFGSGLEGPIVLEPSEEKTAPKPLYLTGEANLVDVTEMKRTSGKALKYLADAEKKLKKGAISDAQSRLESIVRESPESYDGQRLLATAYRKNRNYTEAENAYLASMSLRPRSVTPLMDLAGLYLEQIENGGTTPDATNSLLDKARRLLLQAVRTSPDASFAHHLLGVTYYRSKLNHEAEASFRRALELEPRLADAHLGLVNVYIRVNNWSAVVMEIDVYLKENPNAANREQLLSKRALVEREVSNRIVGSAPR
jgi:cytochrome c-type biogenesis protein CcmH/NrfG